MRSASDADVAATEPSPGEAEPARVSLGGAFSLAMILAIAAGVLAHLVPFGVMTGLAYAGPIFLTWALAALLPLALSTARALVFTHAVSAVRGASRAMLLLVAYVTYIELQSPVAWHERPFCGTPWIEFQIELAIEAFLVVSIATCVGIGWSRFRRRDEAARDSAKKAKRAFAGLVGLSAIATASLVIHPSIDAYLDSIPELTTFARIADARSGERAFMPSAVVQSARVGRYSVIRACDRRDVCFLEVVRGRHPRGSLIEPRILARDPLPTGERTRIAYDARHAIVLLRMPHEDRAFRVDGRTDHPRMPNPAPYADTTTIDAERVASSVGFPRWWVLSAWIGVVFCWWLLRQRDAKHDDQRADHALLAAWVFATPLLVAVCSWAVWIFG